MKLTTMFLLLISCALGFEQESCYLSAEEEDQCASVCYPIVKPLMRYFEVCQTKDRTNAELQKQLSEVQNQLNKVNLKYSELLEKHLASQDKCTDVALKYAEIQEKFHQTHQELRKSQESLQETTLKYEKVQDELKKVNIKNEELRKKDLPETQITEKSDQILEQEKHQSNSETPIRGPVLPDRCPSTQNELYAYRDIQIPGLEPFKVGCFSTEYIGAGWMEVYNKDAYLTEFNRTYEEFINGFGDPRGELFIGLEKLHILTNWKPHEVYIEERMYKVTCANFVVGDRSEGYKLKKLDGCTLQTDHFKHMQGAKFSTYDRDEDGNPNHHWAKEFGFGWWFSSGAIYPGDSNLTLLIRRKD